MENPATLTLRCLSGGAPAPNLSKGRRGNASSRTPAVTIGIVLVASLAARRLRNHRNNDVNLELDQLCRKISEPVEFPFRESVLDDDVLSLDIAKLAQPLPESLVAGQEPSGCRARRQVTYPGDLARLLRARRQRPRRGSVAVGTNSWTRRTRKSNEKSKNDQTINMGRSRRP
jgi:hypothetical protein